MNEVPVIFNEGWDMRASDVGTGVRIIDMQNVWLSKDDIGAIEVMPGDSLLHTLSDNLAAMGVGVNQGQKVEGYDGETIADGTIAFLFLDASGRVSYYTIVGDIVDAGSLLGTTTLPGSLALGSIVRLNDTFYLFMGTEPTDRKAQKSIIGSTSIDDVGVPRPDTTDNTKIYTQLNPGGSNNVVGAVKYWISQIEQGNESAHSEPIRRGGDSPFDLYFDGDDDDINWGDNHDQDGTADFTVEFMLKALKPPANNQFLFGKRADLTDTTVGWSVNLRSTGAVRFTLDNGVDTYTETTSHDIADGQWHRISCSFNATSKAMVVHRDGEPQGSTTATNIDGTPTMANAEDLTAGVDGSGTNDFKGWMYDFRVWDAVRSASDIRGDMNDALVGDETNLVGYWPCDEGTGTTIDDKDANDNNGTLSSDEMWIENESYGQGVINCGNGNRVDIVFAGDELLGNTYNIYRTQADGGIPFFVTQFTPTSETPGTTDTATDDTRDADLGNLSYIHGDEPNSRCIPAVVHASRIFVAHKSRVYWSDIANEESFWWEDAEDTDGHNEVGNWIPVALDDGDRITALVSDYDSLVIFKRNHVYRLYGRTSDQFQLRPVTPVTGSLVVYGTPNPRTAVSTPSGIFFYWNRKVYVLQGSGAQKISGPIEEALNAVDFSGTNANDEEIGASMGYWAEKNQVWLSLPDDSGDGTATATFIYDLDKGAWSGQKSVGYIAAQSVRAGASWQSGFADEEFVGGLGGSGGSGYVYLIADGGPSNVSSDATFTMSPFYGSALNNQKRFSYIDVIFKPEASGDFVIEWGVDGQAIGTGSATVSKVVTGTPSRWQERVHINEMGRELSVRVKTTAPLTNGLTKVFGLVYGYQDFSSKALG